MVPFMIMMFILSKSCMFKLSRALEMTPSIKMPVLIIYLEEKKNQKKNIEKYINSTHIM